jgi:hypothetical protein
MAYLATALLGGFLDDNIEDLVEVVDTDRLSRKKVLANQATCPLKHKVLSRNLAICPGLSLYIRSHQKKVQNILTQNGRWP